MIKRNLLMTGAISRETFSKFFAELAKRTDNPLVNPYDKAKFAPNQIALLVDAIELWEGEKWRFLTMADNARLNPEAHVFPNSMPASIRL